MVLGKVRLYYKNAGGADVPCADVRYRLVEATTLNQVVQGKTDAHGETEPFSDFVVQMARDNSFLNLMHPQKPAPPVGIARLPAKAPLSCRIQVWNELSKQFEAPERYSSKDSDQFAFPASGTAFLHTLRVKPYVQLVFLTKQNNAPIAKAHYIGYTTNDKGKTVVATDLAGQPIKGVTGADGATRRTFCNQRAWFTFTLPGSKVSQDSRVVDPLVKGQAVVRYELPAKSQVATTAPGDGNTVNLGGKVSAPALLNAEDEELILLTPKVWKEFETFSGLIESTMAGQHQAKLDLAKALEAKDPEQIKQAETNLGLAEDKVRSLLNKDFDKLADLKEIVTFESYDKGRTTGNGGLKDRIGMRRRYIPKKKYEELKQKRVMGIPYKVEMKTKAKVKDGAGSASTSIKGNPFDKAKFLESIKKISPGLKKEFSSDPFVHDFFEMGAHQFAETVEKSDSFQIEKSAQWLRFVAGAGASAEANWDPRKGPISAKVQGSLQAKLVLFEGKYSLQYTLPSRTGWVMSLAGEDLGAICFAMECTLYGFVGAKASAMGSIALVTKGNKVECQPALRDRRDNYSGNMNNRNGLPRFDPRVVPAGLNEKPPENINGVSASAEVFAGAEGGVTLSGDLQWLPPQKKDFVSFAKISLDGAFNLGAGASAQVHIYYAGGKFRVKCSARLCWGIGAKGAVDFVVNAEGIGEFVSWVYHQLLYAGFKKLAYVAEDAFQVLSQLLARLIAENVPGSELLAVMKDGAVAMQREFNLLAKRLEKADARERMVQNINKLPSWLIYATPETRGILLYAITRHYTESHLKNLPSTEMHGLDVQVHALPSHKEAILNIMRTVHTHAEWANVMQHMSLDGSPVADAGHAEGDVVRFLDYGWSLNNHLDTVFSTMNRSPLSMPKELGNSYLEKYLKLRSALIDAFPKGYEVALNGTPEFQQLASLDGQMAEGFCLADIRGPLRDDEQGTYLA